MFKLCDLKNIHLSFGSKVIFDDAGIDINEGDHIGLLGLNGKGKSSLFKIIAEDVFPDHSTPPFLFNKAKKKKGENFNFAVFLVPQEIETVKIEHRLLSKFIFNFYPKLATLFQNLDQVNEQIEKDGSEALLEKQKNVLEEIEHLKGWELMRSYESYLKLFGLLEHDKDIENLSGGEQKKVLLSLGLSAPAPLVLWDEPTNHLDLETIKILENEIKGQNKTFLLISHDRYFLSEITNKICHIQHGKIISFQGSYTDYLTHLQAEEENRIKLLEKLNNNLRREDAWMKQGIKARGTRSKKRVENFHNIKDNIAHLKTLAHKQVELELTKSQRKTKSLVQAANLSFSYEEKNIFNQINFTINKGDKIGLLGRNGEGKSTLVKLILEEIAKKSGNFKKADDLSIQYFSQSRKEIDVDKTPFELLGDGNDFVTLPSGHKKHVVSYFESFLFHRDEINRPLSTFSGGEKSRLQLALNLLIPGDLLIFDEPTNDLDLETIQILEKTLSDFKGSLLLISHDRAFLSQVTNKVWLLKGGDLESFEGGYSQVEDYLELSTMEEILLHEEAPSKKEIISNPIHEKKEIKKLSNEDKIRFKEIDSRIEAKESEIDQITTLLEGLSQNASDQESVELMGRLSLKQESLEEELLELYEVKEEKK